MAKTKQNPEFPIEVDGEPYVWRLHRQPQWSSDSAGWRGMAVAVRHLEGQRQLVQAMHALVARGRAGPTVQPNH